MWLQERLTLTSWEGQRSSITERGSTHRSVHILVSLEQLARPCYHLVVHPHVKTLPTPSHTHRCTTFSPTLHAHNPPHSSPLNFLLTTLSCAVRCEVWGMGATLCHEFSSNALLCFIITVLKNNQQTTTGINERMEPLSR